MEHELTRSQYRWVAIGAAVIAATGFARTYYLRFLFEYTLTAAPGANSRRDHDAVVRRLYYPDLAYRGASGPVTPALGHRDGSTCRNCRAARRDLDRQRRRERRQASPDR